MPRTPGPSGTPPEGDPIGGRRSQDGAPDDFTLVPLQLFSVKGNRVAIHLPSALRENLLVLADAVRNSLLGEGNDEDLGLSRLFPPAYQDDPDRNEEYQRLMRDELLTARLGALDIFQAGIGAGELSRTEFDRWLQALNSLRVWLGTRLGVTDDAWEPDPDDRRTAEIGAYTAVGVLLEVALATVFNP